MISTEEWTDEIWTDSDNNTRTLTVLDLDMQAQPDTACLYPDIAVPDSPCVVSETRITPDWMTSPSEGTWANHHNWVAAGRVGYLDELGTEQQGMFIIDISDLNDPVPWGPLGYGGHYFNSISWDSSDHLIAFHLQSFQNPERHGNKTEPGGIYWSDLGITQDASGRILGVSPTLPQLIVEDGAWAPSWRPCYPLCN